MIKLWYKNITSTAAVDPRNLKAEVASKIFLIIPVINRPSYCPMLIM